MCGGGPLFEEAGTHKTASTYPGLDMADTFAAWVIQQIKGQKKLCRVEFQGLREEMKRDYTRLDGYVRNNRAVVDDTDSRVRGWCDEIQQDVTDQLAQHGQTVNSYVKKYGYLDTLQADLLRRIGAIENVVNQKKNTTESVERYHSRETLLLSKMEGIEERVKGLEEQCRSKDAIISDLTAKCSELGRHTAEFERKMQHSLTFAINKELQASTTESDAEARLTLLSQTVDAHGHYFTEIRDRILKNECTTNLLQTSSSDTVIIGGFKNMVDDVVDEICKKSIKKELGEIHQTQEKWKRGFEDQWSRHEQETGNRFKSLQGEYDMLRSSLSEYIEREGMHHKALKDESERLQTQVSQYRTQTELDLSNLRSSFGEELSGYKTAKEHQLARFETEQQDRLAKTEANLANRVGQFQQEVNRGIDDLEARLMNRVTTHLNTYSQAISTGPLHTSSVLGVQYNPVPA